MDLYLSGIKGASAARVAVQFRDLVGSVILEEDPGEANDSYLSTVSLLKSHGIKPLNIENAPSQGESCLAVGWKRLIKSPYTSIFVIHDSLLPKYRGWNPLVTALQNGDTRLGATLLLADNQVDHGPIIRSHQFDISPPAKISEALRLMCDSIEYLTKYLFQNYATAALSTTPQNHKAATISMWRDEEDYRIDWMLSAERLQRFIYSVSSPYKGASTFFESRKIVVLEAEIVEGIASIENPTPGKVVAIDDLGPVVICGKGFLRLRECRFDDANGEVIMFRKIRTRFI